MTCVGFGPGNVPSALVCGESGGGNLTGDTEDKVDGVLVGQCRVVEGLVPTREGGYPVWLRLADLLGVELDDRDVGLVAGHFE